MSQIKRFSPTCDCMSKANGGDYVMHIDHLASHAYDEEKERTLFEAGFHAIDLVGSHDSWSGRWEYDSVHVDNLWFGWLACAKSRARTAGCL